MIAVREMPSDVAAGESVGDERPNDGDDDTDDDLRKPTLHDLRMPYRNGRNMKCPAR